MYENYNMPVFDFLLLLHMIFVSVVVDVERARFLLCKRSDCCAAVVIPVALLPIYKQGRVLVS
jgi:hypothetical protein